MKTPEQPTVVVLVGPDAVEQDVPLNSIIYGLMRLRENEQDYQDAIVPDAEAWLRHKGAAGIENRQHLRVAIESLKRTRPTVHP